MYKLKKISPGGHWIEITGLAIRRRIVADPRALYLQPGVGGHLRRHTRGLGREIPSNYIRPITAIQQTIAPTGSPSTSDAAFSRISSGHSVISMSSATVLTGLFGNDFHYVDSG